MKGVQCYELFGGIALKNHAFFGLFVLYMSCVYETAMSLAEKQHLK